MGVFPISPETESQLAQRLAALGVNEADLEESFVRSSGPGGQHVNKVATAVLVLHKPTGIRVRCESERSQFQNRAAARKLLVEKLERLRAAAKQAERSAAEKIRRQKRKRPRAVKERVLQAKAKQSHKKALRRRVGSE